MTNGRGMALWWPVILPSFVRLARAPTQLQTQNPGPGETTPKPGLVTHKKWCAAQLLKLEFGCPSSSRSPIRFTESLSREAAANTMMPTLGSTNGIDPRAVTNPASFPARLRYLSSFMALGSAVSTGACRIFV